MIEHLKSCRAVVIIKALPRPSKKYGETVCCAGITSDRQWKRLFPVRFRQLMNDQQFKRWQWVNFEYRAPTNDTRSESCHVYEDKITLGEQLPVNQRFGLLDPTIVTAVSHAKNRGASLALIRPRNPQFRYRKKSNSLILAEREAYHAASRQKSFLDEELAAFQPTEYEFFFKFEDGDGSHTWRCGDWETHATFFKWRQQYGEAEALQRLGGKYNDEYPRRGVAFAIGNVLKRPQIWQLLGVIRLDNQGQFDLL